MRILHISNDYFNSGVYMTLHHGFLNRGMDSVFFVPMHIDDEERNEPGVIEAHCFHRYDRFFYMNKQRKIYRQLQSVMREKKPQLLHGYFWFSAGIQCLWAKKEFGVPYVITIQNTDVNFIYQKMIHLRPLGMEILRNAERICFASEAYRDLVLEKMVPPAYKEEFYKKSVLLPFALNPFWTENADTSAHEEHGDPIRIITVGVVNQNKNQLSVAHAVQSLLEKGMDLELTVIGATEDLEVDQKLCGMEFVRRIPKLPKEELIKEYRRADLFVMPSRVESFGLVYAEALSQGVPVLYSEGQGFDKQFEEGYVGFRVDSADVQHIAQSIEKALSQYNTLQKNCADAVMKFSRDTVCIQCEQMYDSCLN